MDDLRFTATSKLACHAALATSIVCLSIILTPWVAVIAVALEASLALVLCLGRLLDE